MCRVRDKTPDVMGRREGEKGGREEKIASAGSCKREEASWAALGGPTGLELAGLPPLAKKTARLTLAQATDISRSSP